MAFVVSMGYTVYDNGHTQPFNWQLNLWLKIEKKADSSYSFQKDVGNHLHLLLAQTTMVKPSTSLYY